MHNHLRKEDIRAFIQAHHTLLGEIKILKKSH